VAAAGDQAGGLSGAPLFQKSTDVLRRARSLLGPSYPLIAVGGIMSSADARKKIDAGADLVQLYTGFIYGGPSLPSRIANDLAAMARR